MSEKAEGGLPPKYVITIGRGFGTGGREIGREIAARLNIPFYDKALLLKAAQKSGLTPEVIEKNDERSPKFMAGLFSFNYGYSSMSWYNGSSPASSEGVYMALCEMIREIANSGPCVIVGRTADHILRDNENVVNIFIGAPGDTRAGRIMARGDAKSLSQAKSLAEKTDKCRAEFYNFYTDKKWGAAESYHLCVDSSSADTDRMVDFIIDFVKLKLNGHK